MKRKLSLAVGIPTLAFAAWFGLAAFEDEGPPEGATVGPPLALYAGPSNTADALLPGMLVREGACLYVESRPAVASGQPTRSLVALPAEGTWWIEETQTIITAWAVFRVGDHMALGGGLAPPGWPEEWVVPPGPECQQTHGVFLAGHWWATPVTPRA